MNEFYILCVIALLALLIVIAVNKKNISKLNIKLNLTSGFEFQCDFK